MRTLKDVGRFLGDFLLQTYVLGPLAGAIPPTVLWIAARDFVLAVHPIPGWVSLPVAALAGLTIFLAVECRDLPRRASAHVYRETLRVTISGPAERALRWGLGGRGQRPADQLVADLYLANLTPGDVPVPRTRCKVRYWAWGVLPAVRDAEGFGIFEAQGVPANTGLEKRFDWWLEPPIGRAGEPLRARVCVVDYLGNEHWTRWLTFRAG